MLKAKLVKPAYNAKNYGEEKEVVDNWNVIGKVKGELKTIVTCRAYMGRSSSASVVYASIWIHGLETSGTGSAGGYGYHKTSAAVNDAIRSAGVELYGDVYAGSNQYNYEEKRAYTTEELKTRDKAAQKKRAYIGGVGDSAIEEALLAIAKLAGGRGKLLIVRG